MRACIGLNNDFIVVDFSLNKCCHEQIMAISREIFAHFGHILVSVNPLLEQIKTDFL